MFIKAMFCQICSFLFFCSCVETNYQKPVYPDKDLKEIFISGSYGIADKKKLEALKKELIANENCNTKHETCGHKLYSSETLEEALAGRFRYVGREGFQYSYSMYCYNETENKEPVTEKSILTKENLRARLYSKEGRLLSESLLILRKDDIHDIYFVEIYLPYDDSGHTIAIVRLEEKKEIIIEERRMETQSKLQKSSEVYMSFGNLDWSFNEQDECHHAPPTR